MQLRGARRVRHIPPVENGFEISESIYRERGYEPPLEALPWSSPKQQDQP
jgi:hypothetical protein